MSAAEPAGPPSLTISRLSAGYPRRPVISDLSLEPLPSGRIVALVGPNGAGKSTLLRALAGFLPATGSVRFGAVELVGASFRQRARTVAFMPQTLPQGIALSVLETAIAALKAAPSGVDGDAGFDVRSHALATLRRVGIADLALEPLDRLSGGQRQLASLAQTVVRDPLVMLLDEPTSALDLRHQAEVMALLRDIAAEGRVVVIVVHDLNLAMRWADRIVVLARGAVAASGPPDEAITPALLAQVWGIAARVEPCSRGRLQVIIDDALDAPAGAPR